MQLKQTQLQTPSLQSWAVFGLDMLGTDHLESHLAHQPREGDLEVSHLPEGNKTDLDAA